MMLAHTTGGENVVGVVEWNYKYRLQHYRQATVLSDHCV